MILCKKCQSEDIYDTKKVRLDINGQSLEKSAFICNDCDHVWRETRKVEVYVNVYLVDRAYGGPQEGGWWYDYGLPQASIPVETWKAAKALKEKLENSERYSNEDRREIGSVLSEGVFQVYFEEKFAEPFPQETQRYE